MFYIFQWDGILVALYFYEDVCCVCLSRCLSEPSHEKDEGGGEKEIRIGIKKRRSREREKERKEDNRNKGKKPEPLTKRNSQHPYQVIHVLSKPCAKNS